jgi:Zn-dependent peptidase ImmA (M78 family)
VNKAALKRLAIELRWEVGLSAYEPFNPLVLAELYGVDVFRLSEIDCSPKALAYFQIERPELFSGALVPLPDGSTVIIENDSHEPERRVSTATHEVAHVTLEHSFAATLTDSQGCRVSIPEQESEAAELSGELLLPTDAAKRLAFNRVTDEEVARQFGISVQFARWRMNATGARKIAARAAARRRRI